ncbi:long-chain acyl-CoA synthetase [Nocardiopsis mwathae]|uniref:Long-chain acyl-CoA synthetase n=1 Tax=Nocardiopsis mwathae TaxID=1472723 RepID=A0A7W9YG90_9ACTN|nr:AMP-binding protein [Nocardiopsis mwathae]MBB6171594.1 long-chain acyl-CoA synthetase [Nocardiopsis mwathae]
MRQSRSDGVAQGPRFDVLGDIAYQRANTEARARVFARRGAEGGWEHVSAGEFLSEVTSLAKGLIAAGVGAGDRIVVVCGARYEWALVVFAAWVVRAVVVPVPSSASAERVRHVLRDCGPAAVVLEDGRHAGTVAGISAELTELARTWRLDEGGLEAIARPGAYMDPTAVRFRREESRREDAAVVAYPVGRVVRARGVVLTHGNVLAAAEGVVRRLGPALAEVEEGRAAALLQLPPSDVHGLAAVVACLVGRVRVGLLPLGSGWLGAVREFRPSVVVCTPRLLEEVHAVERGRARETSWDSLNAYDAATDLAVDFDRAERRGAWKRVSMAMYDWMYARIREALGGRVRVVVCGGWPLGERLDRFYSGAGMPVFQAFGVAESAGAFVVNAPGERRAGAQGRPLPGVEVRLSREGELHVRGEGVFGGYWGDEAASRAAFRDGWLATGFVGEMDAEGYVRVTGRLRAQATLEEPLAPPLPRPWAPRGGGVVSPGAAGAVSGGRSGGAVVSSRVGERGEPVPSGAVPVVAAGGAGVAPADQVVALEQRLRAHPLVSQVMLIGRGRPYVSALITLVRDQLEYWRLVNNRPLSMAPEEIAADPDLLKEIQAIVHEANGTVPPGLAVRAFHVLAEEFTPQSGLVLASGELRRDAVLRAFAEEIDGLYRSPEAG